jgi:hypothetical protein
VRLRRVDQLADVILRAPPRVREPREVVTVALQVADVLFRRDPHDYQLAPLVAAPDRLDVHARRRRVQCAIVAQRVRVIRQHPRRANVIAENVLRHRHTLRARQVIHERTAITRLARPLLIESREVCILLLPWIARLQHVLLCRRCGGQQVECGAHQGGGHPSGEHERAPGCGCCDCRRIVYNSGHTPFGQDAAYTRPCRRRLTTYTTVHMIVAATAPAYDPNLISSHGGSSGPGCM